MSFPTHSIIEDLEKEVEEKSNFWNVKAGDCFHEMYSYNYIVLKRIFIFLYVIGLSGDKKDKVFWTTINGLRKRMKYKYMNKFFMFYRGNYFTNGLK